MTALRSVSVSLVDKEVGHMKATDFDCNQGLEEIA